MILSMKRMILLVGMIVAFESSAFGLTCGNGTLAAYIGLGSAGCTIGDALFSDFASLGVPTGATPIQPGSIFVNPLATASNPGFEFRVDLAVGAGELLEALIGYVGSASSFTGNQLSMNGSSATGDGAVTVVEDKCLGGIFGPGGPGDCPSDKKTLIVFNIGVDADTTEQLSFPPVNRIGVITDIAVDGGLSGTGALQSATNQFQITSATVPEPPTVAMVVLGVFSIGLFYLRRRQAQPRMEKQERIRKEENMRFTAAFLAVLWGAVLFIPFGYAASHREAPITALDHKADITDLFAFRSYSGDPTPKVTLIACVDPFLEPANGPNWFPFDPDILYEIKVDNNNDAVEDIIFQFQFTTEQRLPNLFQVYAGAGTGITAPTNSPSPVPPGTLIVPPKITNFDSPGLGMRQSYTVTMIKGGVTTPITGGTAFFAVPGNVGPRTMDYAALFNAGIYSTSTPGVKVFAGTTDDAFWIDLGAAFDTLNFRSTIAPGVLTPTQDAANENFASDTVSGYAVNSIAIEVPVSMLTRTGSVEAATSPAATIGVWATTSRPRVTVRRSPLPAASSGVYHQIQRMGNPLINELLIGTGFKDRFSMDQPKNDSQFASFFLDPGLARILNAATGGALTIPPPPRTDLLPLVTYAPPIAAPGTPAGPIADLLRLNTGVAPTAPASASRLGLLGGDPAGYPNGRRLFDDVTDISLRAVAGVLNPAFNKFPNNALGDGVNVNDAPYRTGFPYLANAPSGRDRRHIDPGEPGCTAGAGSPCPP